MRLSLCIIVPSFVLQRAPFTASASLERGGPIADWFSSYGASPAFRGQHLGSPGPARGGQQLATSPWGGGVGGLFHGHLPALAGKARHPRVVCNSECQAACSCHCDALDQPVSPTPSCLQLPSISLSAHVTNLPRPLKVTIRAELLLLRLT